MRLALRLSRLMLLAAMLLVSVPLVARSAQAPVNSLSRGAELQTRMALLRRMSDPKLTPVERRQLAQQAAATFSAGPVSISASQPNSTLDAPLGDCTQWSEWFPSTPVFSRVSHAMVYDVTGDRLVLFGGADDAGQASTEVWTLNLTGTPVWSLLATTGTPPSGRYNPSAVYDATRNRMIVFGGSANTNESDADHVYALSLGATPTWTDVSPPGTGPGARVYHTAIYDSGRDRVVVFGGYEFVSTGTVLNEVWAFSLAPGGVWTQITPAGTAPLARIEASAIYDAPRNRMVVFGGTLYDASQTNVGKTREVWSLTLTGTPTWSLLSPGGTSVTPLYGQTAIFDAPRNRMIVYGGVYDIDPSADRPENDVWSLSLTGGTSWSHLSPGGVLPSFGDNHEAVYDAAHQRMRVFGGYGGADETWSLSLNSGPTWAQENTGGIGPRSRVAHSMILDRAAQRVVVFGGQSNYGTLGDVWTHPISGPGAWTRLIPAGGHPTRRGHAAVYDSVGNRMVISGGFDDKSHALQDTWALSLTGTPTWSQLSPSGTPPPGRSDPASAYDRVRRRLLVWSGHDSASFVPLNDLWALSLSGSGSWTHIVAGGDAPNPIDIFTAAYDSQGDEFVVTGLVGSGSSPDVWRLPLVAGGTWTHFLPGADAPASANIQWSAFDPRRRRMIVGDLGGPVYALSLAGTPSWSRLGALGVAYPGHNHPTIVFDQLNDHLLAMGGYGGDYENSLWSQSVLETTHSLSVLAVPSYGGTVASSTQDECLVDGTQVTLTATPEPGYLFASWSGAASGTTNPLTVTISGTSPIRANFVQAPPTCDGWRRVLADPELFLGGYSSVVYDATGNRLIAVGFGQTPNECEAWELPLGAPMAWRKLATSGAAPNLDSFVAAYDPVRDRVILSSGSAGGILDATVWALSLNGTPTWSVLVPAGSGVPALYLPSLTYDPVRDRMLLFGGSIGFQGAPQSLLRNDVYQLSLAATPAWSLIATSGTKPSPRTGHLGIYDPVRDRLIIVGGYSNIDAWTLSLSGTPTWNPLNIAGTPHPADVAVGAIYDPVRDRIVMYGGGTGFYSEPPRTVSAISLKGAPAWITLSADGDIPPGMIFHAAIYDPVLDRMIVSAGLFYLPPSGLYGHSGTYALSLGGGAWLDTYTSPPQYGSVTRSPNGDCQTVGSLVTLTAVPLAGNEFAGWLGDATGTTNPLTVTLGSNQVIGAHFVRGVVPTLIEHFEAERDGDDVRISWTLGAGVEPRASVVERAGAEAGPWLELGEAQAGPNGGYVLTDTRAAADQTWFYRLNTTLANGSTLRSDVIKVEARVDAARLGLTSVSPNPGRGVSIVFTLAREAPVRLSVLDITGREVAVLERGVRGAGRHAAAFGRAAGGPDAAPGIYFVRYVTPGRTETRRIAIIE